MKLQSVLYRGKSVEEWDNQALLTACKNIEKAASTETTSALVAKAKDGGFSA